MVFSRFMWPSRRTTGRLTDRKVQVARPLLDHRVQQLVDENLDRAIRPFGSPICTWPPRLSRCRSSPSTAMSVLARISSRYRRVSTPPPSGPVRRVSPSCFNRAGSVELTSNPGKRQFGRPRQPSAVLASQSAWPVNLLLASRVFPARDRLQLEQLRHDDYSRSAGCAAMTPSIRTADPLNAPRAWPRGRPLRAS